MTERSDVLRNIEGELRVLVRRVRRVVGERARAVHPELSAGSFLLLDRLVQDGPQRAADLACAVEMDKGGVSHRVQQLVDLGLVERRPDPQDRRATMLAATPEAIRRTAAMVAARRSRFDARLAGWSDDQLERFAGLLARYNSALDDQVES